MQPKVSAQAFMASAVMAFLVLVAVQGQISDLPATNGAPDQRQLCSSECETCPVVCSAPPPPASSSSRQSPPQAPPKSSSSAPPSTPANTPPSTPANTPPSTPANTPPSTPANTPPADNSTSDGTRSCYSGILLLLVSWLMIICLSPFSWN